MVTENRFVELIGTVIKTCGLLEWQINVFIKNSSKDRILAKHVIKLPLSRRIGILRDLMLDRPGLTTSEVDSLCKELVKIAEHRNVVAHNPVTVSAERPKIVDVSKRKEFREADLAALHTRTRLALGNLIGLIHKIKKSRSTARD